MKPFEITIDSSTGVIPSEHIAQWNGAEVLARFSITGTNINILFEPPPPILSHMNHPHILEIQKEKHAVVDKHRKLFFGKNIIAWGNGLALYIKGKGYLFVKALYEADGMQLEIADLDDLVWKVDEKKRVKMVTSLTFRVFLHRLSTKLEKAKFPYRLLPTRVANNDDAEITGARLCYS